MAQPIPVYIKQVELTRFKSFGGTTAIPLLPGFTVISGPNGSGKSNILDALLFALGLSGSKGMRADRLPDLVNQQHSQKGRTAEAFVTVTFALDQEKEWIVSRKLRVTSQGTYTSTYYMNGVSCTLTELHQQLSLFHVYPEGYNIVLQGDVTSIISMNSRERRTIIDELAGVGEFDRKITTAKEKLDDVKDQEEKFRIVEQELITAQEKLKGDRVKAEKYQQLRQEWQNLQTAEVVLHHRRLAQHRSLKITEHQHTQATIVALQAQIQSIAQQLSQTEATLQDLHQTVQDLGETKYVQLSTMIATQEAEYRSWQRQLQEAQSQYHTQQEQFQQWQEQIQLSIAQEEQLSSEKRQLQQALATNQGDYDQQLGIVTNRRQELQSVGSSAEAWLQEQTLLRQQLQEQQSKILPLREEQTRIEESLRQAQLLLETQVEELTKLAATDPQTLEDSLAGYQATLADSILTMQTASQSLSTTQVELQTCQSTLTRLMEEQRQKQRQLDRLEAQHQANQELQGTRATRILMDMQIEGIHGLVAQLGNVEPRYRLALEIAAGGKLACIVVESDEVAARAIQILKAQKAGRATFLPLNRMKYAPKLRSSDAIALNAVDYAFNLISFDDRYAEVFAHVCGSTLIYDRLEDARRYIGRYRMVTKEGELLETSGAMTGGSAPQSTIHFGTYYSAEGEESPQLKGRLQEIEQMLSHLQQRMQTLQANTAQGEATLQKARLTHQEAQLQSERLQSEIMRLAGQHQHLSTQISERRATIDNHNQRLAVLITDIQEQEIVYRSVQENLAELEQSGKYEQFFQLQTVLQNEEQHLQQLELGLRSVQQQITDRELQKQRLQEKVANIQIEQVTNQQNQTALVSRQSQLQTQLEALVLEIQNLQQQKSDLEEKLRSKKAERDSADREVQTLRTQQQELVWQLQKSQEYLLELVQNLESLEQQLTAIVLPDLLPQVPESMSIEQLQTEQRRLQKRLQAMEPVNMMAITEYEAVTTRLMELSGRLETLYQERTELLLRIENFTTLRQQAFMQAFDAVNINFQTIFAELSDGDGHLQLENPTDPLNGGLNLVAHPKGKPVRHLTSMSGGEKSLTALSFIFALQRFRPSPFYAFDEVDMFLDGSNVERLSRMVRKQADLAQFIVVSLRRPMIDASERTIGVTQARGMHTQVLGLTLRTGN